MPSRSPAPPLTSIVEAAPVLDDLEALAARENRRLWWRRAALMCFVVAVGAPTFSLIIWMRHTPEPLPPLTSARISAAVGAASANRLAGLNATHRAYMQAEGPSNRGLKFTACASNLMNLGRDVSEAEVLKYLGPPDVCSDDGDDSATWGYFFDQTATKDGVMFVVLTGPPESRVTRRLSYSPNTPEAIVGFHPYIVTTPPTQPTTRPAGRAAD